MREMFMKNLLSPVCLSFLIATYGQTLLFAKDIPTSAEQLRSEFEAALKAKDAKAILALHNWKGVSAEMKSDMSEEAAEMIKQGVVSVKLLPLPADYELTNELNGVRYFPNVRVQGVLKVAAKEEGNEVQIPYGDSSGKYYIAGTVQEVFDTHPKPSAFLSVQVMVMGAGLPDSGKFSGFYVYVQSGKEIKKGLNGVGNLTQTFGGEYIKSCTVQLNPDNRDKHERIQLIVSEDNKKIFDSGKLETNIPVIYEKKN
jgi:hypothetical protein